MSTQQLLHYIRAVTFKSFGIREIKTAYHNVSLTLGLPSPLPETDKTGLTYGHRTVNFPKHWRRDIQLRNFLKPITENHLQAVNYLSTMALAPQKFALAAYYYPDLWVKHSRFMWPPITQLSCQIWWKLVGSKDETERWKGGRNTKDEHTQRTRQSRTNAFIP